MPGTIHHRFVSARADGADATKVRKTEWNDSLVVAGGALGQVFFRDTGAADGWDLAATLYWDKVNNRLGIGTASPGAALGISGTQQAAVTSIQQLVSNNSIAIEYARSPSGGYEPGLIWRATDDNSTLPKAGIWIQDQNSGTSLYFGTSNAYGAGVTNTALIIDQNGRFGVGIAPASNVFFYVGGSLAAPAATVGQGFAVSPTMTAAVGQNAYLFSVSRGQLTEAASGTHTLLAGSALLAPTFVHTVGTSTTNTATLWVENAPTGVTPTGAAYAIWSAAGANRFDGIALFSSGSAAAPAVSFVGATGAGLFMRSGAPVIVESGAERMGFNSNAASVLSTMAIAWSNSATNSIDTKDVLLVRDAANRLALRNGLNAQAFIVTSTFTDSLNFEQLDIEALSANVFRFNTRAAGTGAQRDLAFSQSGTEVWRLVMSSPFPIQPGADNVYDVGTAARRVRTGYFGTAVIIGTNPAASGAIRLSSAGLIQFLKSDGLTTATLIGTSLQDNIVLGAAGINLTPGAVSQTIGVASASWQSLFLNTSLRSSAPGVVDLGAANEGLKRLYLDFTNTATVGNVTINKASGRVNLAAGGMTLTVTNSLVTAASHVVLNAATAPGNAVAVELFATPAAGSFTITAVPAVTNQTAIDFVVINAD